MTEEVRFTTMVDEQAQGYRGVIEVGGKNVMSTDAVYPSAFEAYSAICDIQHAIESQFEYNEYMSS